MHFTYKNKIVCNGSDWTPNIKSNHTLSGVNCPSCLQKSIEIIEAMIKAEADTKVFTDALVTTNPAEIVYLADLDVPAKIIDALLQYSISINDMSILTIDGFTELAKDNNDLSIPGLTEEDQIQLLTAINKV